MANISDSPYAALVVEKLSDDLSGVAVRELPPPPPPGQAEVLVRVRAAAVNFPDVLLTQGNYQFKPDLPFVPGLETAGAGALGRWRQDHLTPLGRIESMGRSWRWQQAGTSGRRQGMRVVLHMVSHPVPAALWTELKELRLINGETEVPQ